jgi:hypothetical protein
VPVSSRRFPPARVGKSIHRAASKRSTRPLREQCSNARNTPRSVNHAIDTGADLC